MKKIMLVAMAFGFISCSPAIQQAIDKDPFTLSYGAQMEKSAHKLIELDNSDSTLPLEDVSLLIDYTGDLSLVETVGVKCSVRQSKRIGCVLDNIPGNTTVRIPYQGELSFVSSWGYRPNSTKPIYREVK